ncbi:hypothetical protein [Filimonas effusa]|uniref:Uncharacterized protein n=1 Tax=Filimonas effusa TaxID=2508721 RepID=A0A4Q1D0R1_9BACT|nr:hypothetical protein [Filimonas effusa]RXK80532.1 hypothetical protein ESB13_23135 [Filimonas effusa]
MTIVLGYIWFFSLIVKIALHIHLDLKHNRYQGIGSAGMNPFELFFPYSRSVKPSFVKEKKICNVLYRAAIITIVLFFVYAYFSGTKITKW